MVLEALKNILNFKNKISQSEKNTVKTQRESNSSIMNTNQLVQEIKSVLDEKLSSEKMSKDTFAEESVASISDIVNQAIREKNEEYKQQLSSAKEEKAQVEAQHQELTASVEEMKQKLEAAEEKIRQFEDEQTRQQALARFNARMEAVEQDYETEKQLERELDFGGTRALRQAGDEAVEDFKQTVGSSRIQEIDIDIEQEDGGVYAIPSVVIKFIFEDTNLTPEKYQSLKDIVRYIPQDMEDYGQNYDIFVKGRSFSKRAYTEARGGMADGENLVITLGIDFMKVNAGMLSFSDPDEMTDTMSDIADIVNTHYEGYKILIQRFLMIMMSFN